MSKLFFDDIIHFEEIDKTIKDIVSTDEELDEVRNIIDEIVNYKVVGKILDKIPDESHEEFLTLFYKSPHDEVAIFGYVNSKAGRDIKEELEKDLKSISTDILHELRPQDEVSQETRVSVK